MSDTISIAGVNVSNITLNGLLSDIETHLTFSHPPLPSGSKNSTLNSRFSKAVLTVNPEIVVQAQKNLKLKEILNSSWRTIADGVGITLAGRLVNKPFKQRITGVELSKFLLALAQEKELTVGVVGGTAAARNNAEAYLHSSFPVLSSWADEGPWITTEHYESFSKEMKTWLDSRKPNWKERLDNTSILFIAMGAPKQEYFIYNLSSILSRNNPILFVAVGGAFDELSGIVKSSPAFINALGLKWLFRLVTQPWRIKRQIRLLQFISFMLTHS